MLICTIPQSYTEIGAFDTNTCKGGLMQMKTNHKRISGGPLLRPIKIQLAHVNHILCKLKFYRKTIRWCFQGPQEDNKMPPFSIRPVTPPFFCNSPHPFASVCERSQKRVFIKYFGRGKKVGAFVTKKCRPPLQPLFRHLIVLSPLFLPIQYSLNVKEWNGYSSKEGKALKTTQTEWKSLSKGVKITPKWL